MDKAEERNLLQAELLKVNRLLESDGYKWLMDIGNQQLSNRLSLAILVPPEGADDMVKKTYELGECAGLKLLMSLTEVQKDQLETDIRNLNRELDND